MKEEFEKLVASGKIGRQHVEPLVELVQFGYCTHRSWGFGKITTVDTVFARLTIDFQNKPGHSMDLGFAAESLRPIPNTHILARKMADLESLRQLAALNHLELIKLVLESYGGKATLAQIQQALVPDIITEDWKKWWDTAKREMKKNGHFQVPVKKSEPIIYHAEEISLQDRLMSEFRKAKGLKAKLAVLNEVLKNFDDLDDPQSVLSETIETLNGEIISHQRTLPAIALEAIFVRDELRRVGNLTPVEGDLTPQAIWSQSSNPEQIFEAVPTGKLKQTLHSFKECNPERWVVCVLEAMNLVSSKVCGECAHLLMESGKLAELKTVLVRLVSQHQASTELLLWLAKERSDAFADILGPEVFRAMLTAIERDQFNDKKSNRLRDHVVNDKTLVVDLIESADIDVIKDITRALQLSTCFTDMDKRSLLARIVKNFPAVQTMVAGESSRQDNSLVVSWESLERRKQEYHELVQKKIPANSRDIAIARSYGDLRENHEYKSAKEMQKLLMRRKTELESQLTRSRGTDFANPRTDIISVGARVTVTDPATQHSEQFAILGAWDFDADHGIISYLSPVAQALLNRKVGDEVEFEMEGVKRRYRVEQIEPYIKSSEPAEASPSPVSSAANA